MGDMDFEKLAQLFKIGSVNENGHVPLYLAPEHRDWAVFALLLAQELQSGEVSEAMVDAHFDYLKKHRTDKEPWVQNQFKAMTRALIEKTRNELQHSDKEVGDGL